MRTITAKFKSACKKCGGSIAEGSECKFDDETRKVYHTQCAPEEQAELPSPEQHRLADQLGFKPHAEAFDMDWPVFLLSRKAADRPVEPVCRDNGARGEQSRLWGMRAGQESA